MKKLRLRLIQYEGIWNEGLIADKEEFLIKKEPQTYVAQRLLSYVHFIQCNTMFFTKVIFFI